VVRADRLHGPRGGAGGRGGRGREDEGAAVPARLHRHAPVVHQDATLTLVYNPDIDAGSLAYIEANYKHAPSFARARAYRDALLSAQKGEAAINLAQDYRRADPGPDAEWLVGDTYRTLGELQKAADEGFWAFYRFDQEFSGDRLARWQEVKAWLTEMVQSNKISRPKE
jgi:hypothetical protein